MRKETNLKTICYKKMLNMEKYIKKKKIKHQKVRTRVRNNRMEETSCFILHKSHFSFCQRKKTNKTLFKLVSCSVL